MFLSSNHCLLTLVLISTNSGGKYVALLLLNAPQFSCITSSAVKCWAGTVQLAGAGATCCKNLLMVRVNQNYKVEDRENRNNEMENSEMFIWVKLQRFKENLARPIISQNFFKIHFVFPVLFYYWPLLSFQTTSLPALVWVPTVRLSAPPWLAAPVPGYPHPSSIFNLSVPHSGPIGHKNLWCLAFQHSLCVKYYCCCFWSNVFSDPAPCFYLIPVGWFALLLTAYLCTGPCFWKVKTVFFCLLSCDF